MDEFIDGESWRIISDEADCITGPAEDDAEIFPAPAEPLKVVRLILPEFSAADGTLTLRSWRAGWMEWRRTHWVEIEEAELRAVLYRRLEHVIYWHDAGKNSEYKPWAPNKRKIGDVLDALRAATHLSETVDAPAWLIAGGHAGNQPPANQMVSATNGLLHVGTRQVTGHTAEFFNRVSVPFDYDPGAPPPVRWHRFLHDLWGDDAESVAALHEFFGYVLSGRTDLQKVLLMVGPTRSGKGTIARVLEAMVGRNHVAAPTLSSLSGEFGLAPLLGKPLAVVSDARLNGANASTVVERLLSVSGEDMLTVNRKYREQWTGKLPTRFVIISNELPNFGDASGAIANRFIVLQMFESFLGRENPSLTDELLAELPGILNWALDGLDDLTHRGRFTIPKSSDDAIAALADLVSPVSAFVRDCCEVGPYETEVKALHLAWRSWCEDNGHKVTSAQVFGRDLRAVIPQIRVRRPRTAGGQQVRYWTGIKLAPQWPGRDSTRLNTPGEPLSRDESRPQQCGTNHDHTRCGRGNCHVFKSCVLREEA